MNLHEHRKILSAALSQKPEIDSRRMRWIVLGNLSCDFHQFSAERHFDNAPDRETITALWQKGLRRYLDRAIKEARGDRSQESLSMAACFAFGEASHTLADFYAHTNWVEIHAEHGILDRTAPLVGNTLLPVDLPPGLESGFFSLRYGFKGCPRKEGVFVPPTGFSFCHEGLAKDHPQIGHGAEAVFPGGPTFYEVTYRLAVISTGRLWDYFAREIALSMD